MEGLGRILALRSQACEVNLSCCSAASLFSLSAWAALGCYCPDVTFSALVPPFLLRLGPHLRDPTGLAVERHVNVVPALGELRRVIAIGWAKVLWIYKNVPLRQFPLCARLLALMFAHQFGFLCGTLDATALQDRRASGVLQLHAA